MTGPEAGGYELEGSTVVHEGRIVSLAVETWRLPDGGRTTREVVLHPGAACVVCIDGGELVLVRQFREAAREALLEIVAGRLEPGEDPAAAAARELEEEVGLSAGHLEPLGRFHTSPGFATELMHAYFATDVTAVPPRPDHDEFIEVVRIDLSAAGALDDVLSSLSDAKSIAAVALAARRGLLGAR